MDGIMLYSVYESLLSKKDSQKNVYRNYYSNLDFNKIWSECSDTKTILKQLLISLIDQYEYSKQISLVTNPISVLLRH